MNTSLSVFGPVGGGAIMSKDEQHRFKLWRMWEPKRPQYLFILLNPSRADHTRDDPTSLRLRHFVMRWGGGGYQLGNLFTVRATSPDELYSVKNRHDLNRPDSEGHLLDAIMTAANSGGKVVVGWGTHGHLDCRDDEVLQLLKRANITPYCFEVTKGGHPKHPLYCKGNTQLREFTR